MYCIVRENRSASRSGLTPVLIMKGLLQSLLTMSVGQDRTLKVILVLVLRRFLQKPVFKCK